MERALVRLVQGTLALALVTPLVVTGGWLPDFLYPHVFGKAVYFRLMVEVAFALWLVLIVQFPSYRPRRSWLIHLILAYMVVSLLATFAGVSPTHSLWSNYERMQGWIGLAHYTMFAMLSAAVLRTLGQWKTVLNLNLLVGLLVGLLGLYDIATGGSQRLSVTFGNPSFLASYALVNAFVAAALLAHSFARDRNEDRNPSDDPSSEVRLALMRSFWIAVVCLDLTLLNYSGTRGAVVGLISGVAVVAVACGLWGGGRRLQIACVVCLLGILALVTSVMFFRGSLIPSGVAGSSPTFSRIIEFNPESTAVRSRVNSVNVGLKAFNERPTWGWGPENYAAAYDSHLYGEAAVQLARFDQAHNRVVEELVTTGIVGFTFYMAIWLCLGWLVISRARTFEPRGRWFVIFIGGAFTAHFVQNLFLFDTPASSVQLYLLIGLALFLAGAPATSLSDERRECASPQPPRRWKFTSSARGRQVAAALRTIAMVAVIPFVLALSYFVVARPCIGAVNTFIALSGEYPSDVRFAAYRRALEVSPELANETTRRFLNVVIDHWESLPAAQRRDVLEFAPDDVSDGLSREPMKWQLNVAIAQIYNQASNEEPGLVAIARQYTDAAEAIAPERIEVFQLKVQQLVYEGKSGEAIELIDEYIVRYEPQLEKDSRVYRHLEKLRNGISASRRQN